jgi:GNAT superfamily N-acetyltransferase
MDARALAAMHARCSAHTVSRRYHAQIPYLSPRLARRLLEPADGLSLVLTVGDDVGAVGMLAPDPGGFEVALMVEDRWQRQGYGTRLLHALAVEAANRGVHTLTCRVRPDNAAVLPTIRRAGLRALVDFDEGLTRYRIPVAELTDPPRKRNNRPAMAQVTTPPVSLLHARREPREIYPPADFIDQAVRGGA